MLKKKSVLIFSIILSVIFTIVFLFISSKISQNVGLFHVVQVGAFSSKENANELTKKLTTLGKQVYQYENEGLTYVLTCIDEKQNNIDSEMDWLSKNQMKGVERTYHYRGIKPFKSLSKKELLESINDSQEIRKSK